MNLEDVWNSAGNAPLAVGRETLVAQARDVRRRLQRRRVAFVAWTAIALGGATAMAAYVWVSRRSEIAGFWPLLLLLGAQWMLFVHFLRQMLAGRGGVASDASIRESLERLGREAENERHNQVAMLSLFTVAAPLLAMAIVYLREAGKMAPHEVMSAGALFGAVIVINVVVILVRRYRVVLPRHRRLSALLQQYRVD